MRIGKRGDQPIEILWDEVLPLAVVQVENEGDVFVFQARDARADEIFKTETFAKLEVFG
jgi:hypothetical protein